MTLVFSLIAIWCLVLVWLAVLQHRDNQDKDIKTKTETRWFRVKTHRTWYGRKVGYSVQQRYKGTWFTLEETRNVSASKVLSAAYRLELTAKDFLKRNSNSHP